MRALPEHLVARLARSALMEDLGPGDLTCEALVPETARARAAVTAGAPLVAAGLEPAICAFLALDPALTILGQARPGEALAAGATLLSVEGSARALLSAERTALNFIGRLSGIATLTRDCVRAVAGTGAAIYDTRKTTPGLRPLEKDAVALGGGRNHRSGLFDAVLIKDNHLPLAGGAGAAVRRARERFGGRYVIEVEVEDLAGLGEALAAGADIVLLDNMALPMMVEAVRLRDAAPGTRVALEASGGITLANIRAVAGTGVDRISLGALTHSAPSADVSLTLS